MPTDTNRNLKLSGHITDVERNPVQGVIVQAYLQDAQGAGSPLEEEAVTDSNGGYAIDCSLPREETIHRLYVEVYAEDGILLATSAVLVFRSQKDHAVIDVRVNATQLGMFQVDGKVSSHFSAGVVGLRVSIVDKGIGADVPVAETTTVENGAYRVTFTGAKLAESGKQKPDLQAHVFSDDRLIGSSDVCYDASPRETLNVRLDEKAGAALQTEYETLMVSLSRLYSGRLADLKETDAQQDITYLANKTGWDARAIALAALSDQFSSRTQAADGMLEPVWFYALFRAGLPAEENALYQADPSTIQLIWRKSIAQQVIPARLESQIPSAVERFQQLTALKILERPALVGISSLKEMLTDTLGKEIEKQTRFAKLYTENGRNRPAFWEAVRAEFGETAEKRLRVYGQLAYLTLNNGPLISRIRTLDGNEISNPVQMVTEGYYRAQKWDEMISDDSIPPEILGANQPERRQRYAEFMAAQVRLSYPTAVVAQMVKTGETRLEDEKLTGPVNTFLAEHQGRFEIGIQPVEQYIARNQLQVAPEVAKAVARIQRVFQLTPDHESMNTLLKKRVDSASAIVRYDRSEFVQSFKDELGGEDQAALIHAKAQQIYNVVLNLVISYLSAKNAPAVGSRNSPPAYIAPEPNPSNTDVIAYPTLEGLFQEFDFCDCEHCRSILSPAAYLVDLLQFCRRPTDEKPDPQEVLFERRPDIQHLALTCENTNISLPYIDLVNETLGYYVANNLSLANYEGHNTGTDASPEELLANPQFVTSQVFLILAGKPVQTGDPEPVLPPTPPLPFHQPLESLRRYFDHFEVPLPDVMESLRANDNLERASDYGWRDILMEELRLSRAEYALLTERALNAGNTDVPHTIRRLFGFDTEISDENILTELSSAKRFAQRVDIRYEELIEILTTRFINPHSALIPKLEALGVSFATLKMLHESTKTGQDWLDLLPQPIPDARHYGGNIRAWVKDQANFEHIMGLITLMDPSGSADLCSFDTLEFRYSNPDTNDNKLRGIEFVSLLRFIRLWKKLGWTIDQTDKSLAALYPSDQLPDDANDAINLERLDAGFLVFMPRLGVIKRAMKALHLSPKQDLLALLACFGSLDTHGSASLYRQMFLSPALLKQDPVFAEDGFGGYLTDNTQKLLAHSESLRAAFQMTEAELNEAANALGFDANTTLDLANISAIFRRGWLARKLKLSQVELRLLIDYTGIDPYTLPDPPEPSILQLIALVNLLRAVQIKPVQALYLFWNQDLSGKSAPKVEEVLAFARGLRSSFTAIEAEFALADDPEGQIARSRMGLVYGTEATDFFFGLIDRKVVTDVAYTHGTPELEQAILNTAPGLSYDHLRKRLSYSAGVLSEAVRDALLLVPGTTLTFQEAVRDLHLKSRLFFERYPELLRPHDIYLASTDPLENRRRDLLASFLPELMRRRKRQHALQAISVLTGSIGTAAVALLFAAALLQDKTSGLYVLHAAGDSTRPGLDDLIDVEKSGLTARFFFRDTASGNVDETRETESILSYSSGKNPLPDNSGNPISGIWSGFVEAPENGYFNFLIDTDLGASVKLSLNGAPIPLEPDGTLWSNSEPVELHAGTVYRLTLKVEKITQNLNVRWESAGRGQEIIPAQFLYPLVMINRLRQLYTRFFKTASLAELLKLTPDETALLARHVDTRIAGQSWVNSLPVDSNADNPISAALLRAFELLLNFTRIKSSIAFGDERLLVALNDPVSATETSDSLLFTLTRWEPASLTALLTRFGKTATDLIHLDIFVRVMEAMTWAHKLGISIPTLILATTNDPVETQVLALQAALRARHNERDWLKVLQPINDVLRDLQRNALVAYILHQMRMDPQKAYIDTPEKLFEFFLMDVQMEPCMQTSRIRNALSSVQLFIERCLMNLEVDVSPSSISAEQWQWMNRYRVWEANRKVFLWPENWAEPELRDDQSSFFKEMMSELLQGDITEERAALGLLNYLAKLDEIAKLEICGVYHEEHDRGSADDIVHVVARTAGANRRYFYRRRDPSGWTPWEQIKLDIEDNPVIPLVWNGRLFIFWLRILQKAPIDPAAMSTSSNQAGSLADLKLENVKIDARDSAKNSLKMSVQAILCWSEFYNGKWQLVRTSDVARPLDLDKFDPMGVNAFDRSQWKLAALFYTKGALRLIVTNGTRGASFFLHNAFSLPELRTTKKDAHFPFKRSSETSTSALKFHYPALNISHLVLNNSIADRTIEPNHSIVGNPWDAPFFYEDGRHVFYVTTIERFVPLPHWDAFDVVVIPPQATVDIPPLVLEPNGKVTDVARPISKQPGFGVVDPSPIERYITEDAYIHRGLGTNGTISFGEKEIGPAGSQVKTVRSR